MSTIDDGSRAAEHGLDVAALTDPGGERALNEDACGVHVEDAGCALVVVADGVSGAEAGEVASQMAVEVVLRAFREQPAAAPAGQRLYRAVQHANIEIYDRAIAVPELRGMATTLTAAVVDRGLLTVVHVGDSRAYLLRDEALTQLTKDHTLAAEKTRYHLMSRERARSHADRSVLTRSVGRELIVSRDQSTQRLAQGDLVLLCSDGLYNTLDDPDLVAAAASPDVAGVCRALVDAANARHAPDNVTVGGLRLLGAPRERPPEPGLWTRLRRTIGRG